MAKKKSTTVIIDGRISRDMEVRQAGSYRIGKFDLCHNNSKKVDGQWQDDPMFITVEYFLHDHDQPADFRKGVLVEINAALKCDKWTDRESGQARSKFKLMANEVTFTESTNQTGGNDGQQSAGNGERFEDESDIPF